MNAKQNRMKQSVLIAAVAATLIPHAARATVKINEMFFDAPGVNATQDFIELKSDAVGGVESVSNMTVLLLEGDAGAAGGTGTIDHYFPLSGSTGTNGLFIAHTFASGPSPAIDAATGVQNSITWTPSTPVHENASSTWMVVSGFAGSQGQDLDTNDDGVFDVTPWTSIIDAVGATDGGATDNVYGAINGSADFNANASGITVQAAVRDPNGVLHGVEVVGAVGGPYAVSGGFTIENGYQLTPGNANTAPTILSRGWRGTAGASWNTAGNWAGGTVPSAAGDVAIFDGAGANSISLASDVSIGTLTFNGGNQTISAGGGTLIFDTVTGDANVLMQRGTVTMAAPITLNKTTRFRIGGGASLTLNSVNGNGNSLIKQGTGPLTLNQSLAVSTMNITSGSISFPSDGSKNKVIVANTLTMSGTTSRIDLSDNKLITNTAVGTLTGTTYSDVLGMVQKGRGGGGWGGQGVALRTSQSDALFGVTTLGVASGAQIRGLGPTDTALFAGQTITGASTIVMYTYAGDANLSGHIDADDYFQIDSNYGKPTATLSYFNGDFDYDGDIDGDDFSVIDSNFSSSQGNPFPTAAPAGVTAVPEPSSLLGLVALAGLSRRRRTR